MLRLLVILLILAGLFGAWKSGALESIRSGGVPEYGRECTIDGPLKNKGVPAAIDPESLVREIDTHVGSASSERLAGAMGLQSLLDSGELAIIPAKSKVRVVENGSVTVQGMPYNTVKVRILEGKLKDVELWIERINLIDTPIQVVFQAIRQQGKPAEGVGTTPTAAGSPSQ